MLTRMAFTEREAFARLKKQGLLPLTTCGSLTGLTELVAGKAIKGSWWAHPRGKLIFRIASALEDDGDVLVVKLVHGKQTFVHASLWPALLRVVLAPEWRKTAIASLRPDDRSLVAIIERRGTPKYLVSKLAKRADAITVKRLLVHVRQEHSEAGHHQTIAQSWRAIRVRAKFKGSASEALKELSHRAGGESLPGLEPLS